MTGTYAREYSRAATGPCHRSQSRSAGGHIVGGGKLRGGTNQGSFGRSVQVTTSATSPTTPASTHSLIRRMPSNVWPWFPIWVTTPKCRAALRSVRACQMLWASGFSTKTCLPSSIAAIAIGKWLWSGVEIVTASISLCILSSITRKSLKRGTSGCAA